MRRLIALGFTAALVACGGSNEIVQAPTTTSATVQPSASASAQPRRPPPAPAPTGTSEPPWSPSPQPGSSQMPFDLR